MYYLRPKINVFFAEEFVSNVIFFGRRASVLIILIKFYSKIGIVCITSKSLDFTMHL